MDRYEEEKGISQEKENDKRDYHQAARRTRNTNNKNKEGVLEELSGIER